MGPRERNTPHIGIYKRYNMSTTENVDNFKALVSVLETYSRAYGCKPGLLRAQLIKKGLSASDLDAPDLIKLKNAEKICCQ